MAKGAIWHGYPEKIRNTFGLWQRGVERDGFSDPQIAQLGPGFDTGTEGSVVETDGAGHTIIDGLPQVVNVSVVHEETPAAS